MIRFERVSKSFGTKRAVEDLCLSVARGELFALLGPNGAGKTTTIKMLCGLLEPSGGTIAVGGFDVQRQGREARQLVGYIPDQPYLYDKLTAREFLRFVGRMYGMVEPALASKIDEQIETFGMGGYADGLIESYSHGMKQRVVFASALLHDPPVLVVDEPMVGLDPKSAKMVKDLLRARAREGTTIFMSTHTLAIAEQVADRIGIFDRGRLIACGSLEELQRTLQIDRPLEELFLRITAGEEVES